MTLFIKKNYEIVITSLISAILLAAILGGLATWSAVLRIETRFSVQAAALEKRLSVLAPKLDDATSEIARVAGALEEISKNRRIEIEFFSKRSEELEKRLRVLEKRQ